MKRTFSVCAFLLIALCYAADDPYCKSKYFDYLRDYPHAFGPCGDSTKGEIEILTDPELICEAQQRTGRPVGILAEDRYWIWVNDAVRFPNGNVGVYGRMIGRWSLDGIQGVIVTPVLSNGKIGLIRTFRHATRSWEYELPRGAVEKGETIQEAAIRETREESGLEVGELRLLGWVNPDSGMESATVPIFLARVFHAGDADPQEGEVIAGVDFFSVKELKQGFIDGYLGENVPLRDPFLAYSLLALTNLELLPPVISP